MKKRFNAAQEWARRNAQKVAAVTVTGMTAIQANAASVIDTATKTAITSGFTDLKDTLLDVLGVAYPYVIGGAVILASPRIVKGLIKLASK